MKYESFGSFSIASLNFDNILKSIEMDSLKPKFVTSRVGHAHYNDQSTNAKFSGKYTSIQRIATYATINNHENDSIDYS